MEFVILRFFPLLFASSCLWGLTDGDTWAGGFQESNITLSANSSTTIFLDRDPNIPTNRGNIFGERMSTNLNLTSSGGQATLILQKTSSLPTIQFYHQRGNTISVSNGANLRLLLGQHSNTENFFYLSGGVLQDKQWWKSVF